MCVCVCVYVYIYIYIYIYTYRLHIAAVGRKPPMSKFGKFHIFSQIDAIGQSPRVSVILTHY